MAETAQLTGFSRRASAWQVPPPEIQLQSAYDRRLHARQRGRLQPDVSPLLWY
ncbi:MAG TPA: hypothetical protein PKH77_04660 [Anaerolineae bacterium]|nr:hypothetical protein [Anaerolineae bacterium]